MHKELYVSSKIIVAKVQRDFKLVDTSYISDALVWLGEAIGHIGVYNSRQPVEFTKKVIDYKVAYPCGLDNFLGITSNGMLVTLNPRITGKPEITRLNGMPHSNKHFNYTDTYFTFNFTDEDVTVHYMGIPMDCEFPKIPNNDSYKEACIFYIMNRLIMGGYVHPIFTFDYTWQRFEHFAQRARNEVDELKITDMEQFLQEWTNPFLGADVTARAFGANNSNIASSGKFDPENPFAISKI